MRPTVRQADPFLAGRKSSSTKSSEVAGQYHETGAVRRLLHRAGREEKPWNEAGSKHVPPRAPALEGWGVSAVL